MIKFIKNIFSTGADDNSTNNAGATNINNASASSTSTVPDAQVHLPEQKSVDLQIQDDLAKLQQREQIKKIRSTEKEKLFDRTMKPRTLSENEIRAQESMKIRNPFKGE